MNLNINLATRVYVNFKRVNFFLGLSLLLCFCWITFNLYVFAINLEKMTGYSEISAKKGSGAAEGSTTSDAEYGKFVAKVKNVNDILYKRSYDWLSLLENLEQLVPSGVSLKSLQPANKGETLSLTGTATSFSSIRKFTENLEGSKTFTEVYLTDHAYTLLDNKRQVINFTVTCKASIS